MLQNDIDMLTKKLNGTFDFYTSIDITSNADTWIGKRDETHYTDDKGKINNYLSQIQGRKRCYNMYKMTRKDSLEALKKHYESQKNAYIDMLTFFTDWGLTNTTTT